MKKILIATGIITLGLAVISCNKIKEKLSAPASNEVNPFSVNSGDTDRDIIAFNNKVVKMEEDQNRFIKDFQNELTEMDAYVKNALANPQSNGITPLFLPAVMTGFYKEMKAPKVLGNEYQKKIDIIISTFSELQSLQKDLETYKEAQDWKDDKGKKLAEIDAKAQKLIEQHQNTFQQLFEALSAKADQAEVETLKNHPLKDQIVRSREIMELTQKIVKDSYNFKDINAYKILFTQQYQQLEKLYNKNIDNKIPSEEKQKESSYNSFNSAINDFLGKMRIVQRSLNENNDQLNHDLDELEREAESVLNRYNLFVD